MGWGGGYIGVFKKGHFSPVLIGAFLLVQERKYVPHEILRLSPIKVNGVIVRNLRKKGLFN